MGWSHFLQMSFAADESGQPLCIIVQGLHVIYHRLEMHVCKNASDKYVSCRASLYTRLVSPVAQFHHVNVTCTIAAKSTLLSCWPL